MSLNYPESKEILKKIKVAKKIVISLHERADGDSLGSSLALKKVIEKMGKKVDVISSGEVSTEFNYLVGEGDVKIADFNVFDFTDYDLYIIPDTASIERICGDKSYKLPKIDTLVIDNHQSNKGYGTMNLIDHDTSSVCEILFRLFSGWKIKIDKRTATYLLAGIYDDTGSFQHEVYKNTFIVADRLIKAGVDYKNIVKYQFRTQQIDEITALGSLLQRIEVDEKNKFAYLAVSFTNLQKIGNRVGLREMVATSFIQTIDGTDFGIVMFEEDEGELSVSFRSRTEIDVSEIANKLGGGGHPGAAGARVKKPFKSAVDLVLKTIKENL